MKLYLVLFLTFFYSFNGYSQNEQWKTMYERTLYYFNNRNYESAVRFGERVLDYSKRQETQTDSTFMKLANLIGISYYNLKKYPEAEPLFKVVIEIKGKLFGDEHRETANSLYDLANTYYNEGKYSLAEPLYMKVLEIRRSLFGSERLEVAHSLNNLANNYYNQKKYRIAEPLYKEALVIYSKIHGKDHVDIANCLNSYGNLYYNQAKYNEAETFYKRSADIYKKLLGENHPSTKAVMVNLERISKIQEKDNKDTTLALQPQENKDKSKISKQDNLPKGKELEELTSKWSDLIVKIQSFSNGEKYEEAIKYSKEALEIAEKAFGMNDSLTSFSYLLVGFQMYMSYNYSGAEPYFEKGIAIGENIFGIYSLRVAIMLYDLADLYDSKGKKYDEAEKLYKRVLEIKVKVFGENHPEVAKMLNKLAFFYRNIGRYADEERLHKRELSILEKVKWPQDPAVGDLLHYIAIMYHRQGKYKEVEIYYKRALPIREKHPGNKHYDLTKTMLNLADVYVSIGRFSEAESLYKHIIEIEEKVVGPNSYTISKPMNNLARLYFWQGRYPEAEPLYKKALAIREKMCYSGHSDVNETSYELARLYEAVGKYSETEQISDKLLYNITKQLELNFSYASENEKKEYIENVSYNFPVYFSFALRYSKENSKISEKIYNLLLWQKGILVTSTVNMIKNILNSGNIDAIKVLDKLKTKREKLAKLYTTIPDDFEKHKKEIGNLEKECSELEKELSGLSGRYAKEKKLQNVKWNQIAKKLKDDEAAVEFFTFKYFDKKWTDTSYYCALIINKNTREFPVFIVLGTEKELRANLDSYKISISQDPLSKSLDKENKHYNFIWNPIEKYLDGVKRIFLSPDGILNQLSFGVLVNNDGRFLNEKYEIRYVSSTKDILDESENKDVKKYSILIGNPSFSADMNELEKVRGVIRSKTGRQSLEIDKNQPLYEDKTISSKKYRSVDFTMNLLPELPGTKEEIDEISKILTSNDWNVKTYTGKDAVKEVIKEAGPMGILHIATHGFFLPEKEIDYDRLLEMIRAGEEVSKSGENPMLRSGLFFAGANNMIQTDKSDEGILTAYEASNLNLQNTELVILSACETGLGDIKAGEGVFGLRRAFQIAGAEAVIMSLWSVPDKETQELMTKFYKKWIGGKDKYTSFRESQNEMREIVKNRYGKDKPFYWGAFVMVGK